MIFLLALAQSPIVVYIESIDKRLRARLPPYSIRVIRIETSTESLLIISSLLYTVPIVGLVTLLWTTFSAGYSAS